MARDTDDRAHRDGRSGNPYDSSDFPQGYFGPYYAHGYTPAPMWGMAPIGTERREHGSEGRNLSDSDIQNAVYDALDNDPAIPWNAEITATVKDHVVTLDGTVGNKAMKQAAGYEAWETPGVDDVHNNLQIEGRRHRQGRTPSDGQRTSAP